MSRILRSIKSDTINTLDASSLRVASEAMLISDASAGAGISLETTINGSNTGSVIHFHESDAKDYGASIGYNASPNEFYIGMRDGSTTPTQYIKMARATGALEITSSITAADISSGAQDITAASAHLTLVDSGSPSDTVIAENNAGSLWITGDELLLTTNGIREGMELIPVNSTGNSGGIIRFREDAAGQYGMSIKYDGGANELSIFSTALGIDTTRMTMARGTGATVWSGAMTINADVSPDGVILQENGSSSTPAIRWSSDSNLGMYRQGTDELRFQGTVGINTGLDLSNGASITMNGSGSPGVISYTSADGVDMDVPLTITGITTTSSVANATNPMLTLVNATSTDSTGASIDWYKTSTGTTLTGQIDHFRYGTSDYGLAFSAFDGGMVEHMVLRNSFMGVGTNNPAANVHVNGTTPKIMLSDSVTGQTSSDGAFIGLSGSQTLDIWHREASSIRFGTSGTERMTIDASGNVGIGNTTSTFPLEVDGDARVEGQLFIGTGIAQAIFSTGGNLTLQSTGGSVEAINDLRATAGLTFDGTSGIDLSGTSMEFTTGSAVTATLDNVGNLNIDGDLTTGDGVYFSDGNVGVHRTSVSDCTIRAGAQNVLVAKAAAVDISVDTTVTADLYADSQIFVGGTFTMTNSNFALADCQTVLGGAHNGSFNTAGKCKLLITGSNNDVSTPTYDLYIESENGDGIVCVQHNTSGVRMGINNGSPSSTLDVVGDMELNGDLTTSGGVIRTSSGSAGAPSYSFSVDSDSGMYYGGSSEVMFSIGGSERLAVYGSGAGGIEVTGDVLYTGSLSDISDRKAKKRIRDYDPEDSVKVVRALKLRKFDKRVNGIDVSTDAIGVIAQEAREVDPGLINETDRSFMGADDREYQNLLTVNQGRLIMHLLSAVQTLLGN